MDLLLQRLRIKYSGEVDDAVAMVYIEDALEYCIDFTRQTSSYAVENLGGVIVSIALENISKRGAEGLKSQGYSGVSESYSDDVSESIKKQLYRHRRL